MILQTKYKPYFSRHRAGITIVLCLLILCVFSSFAASRKTKKKPAQDERVRFISDELRYDMYGPVPDAQIVKGNVQFFHKGARLWCDSAYFYEAANSFKAFGHVKMIQGDTLSLTCERAYYDGQGQMMEARQNVILKHRGQTLHTDSLN